MKKKLKKLLRPFIASYVVPRLPDMWQTKFILKNLKLESRLEKDIEFKVATTHEELEQVFRLLHNSYVAEGFMKPHESGIRLTKYHALPTTTVLVAKVRGKVVATLSLIKEGGFGFPCQEILPMNDIKEKPWHKIAEISSLAIEPSYRHRMGSILFPLLKYMYEYGRFYFHLDYIAIVVHPRWFTFYDRVLCFKRITQSGSYDFANGNPGVLGVLDLNRAPYHYFHRYEGFPKEKNLFTFFTETQLHEFYFPTRTIDQSFDFLYSADLFEYFFVQKENLLADLTKKELIVLARTYPTSEFKSIWSRYLDQDDLKVVPLRQEVRYHVKFPVRVRISNNLIIDGFITDISRNGFCLVSDYNFHAQCMYSIQVKINPFHILDIRGECLGQRSSSRHGFKALGNCEKWWTLLKEIKFTSGTLSKKGIK